MITIHGNHFRTLCIISHRQPKRGGLQLGGFTQVSNCNILRWMTKLRTWTDNLERRKLNPLKVSKSSSVGERYQKVTTAFMKNLRADELSECLLANLQSKNIKFLFSVCYPKIYTFKLSSYSMTSRKGQYMGIWKTRH